MFSVILQPSCIRPLYFQNSLETASYCGRINGYFYSVILTFAFLFVIYRYFYKREESKLYFKICVVAIIFIIWLVIPEYSRVANENQWKGYVDIKSELAKKGYSEIEIMNTIQSFKGQGQVPTPLDVVTGRLIVSSKDSTEKPKK